MATPELRMRCQRCGEQMEMKDPAPGGEWKPDQFWVCPKCGRHFWTTHPSPPKPPAPKEPVVAPAEKPPAAAAATGTADPGPSR